MAEIELSALARDLPERVGDQNGDEPTRRKLAGTPEPGRGEGGLAVQHRRRPRQATKTLPDNRRLTVY
jgi:hypothetical protein